MQTFQTWIGVGHTTHEVEMHRFDSGTVSGRFVVACNYERSRRGGEPIQEVLFMRCRAWGQTAEFLAQYAPKGSLLTVQGRLQEEKWTDKTTGQERSQIICVIEQARLLKAARGDNGGGGGYGGGGYQKPPPAPEDDGDLGPVPVTVHKRLEQERSQQAQQAPPQDQGKRRGKTQKQPPF